MKNSTARRLVALGLGAALVLSGCSSSDDDDATATPTVETTASAEDLAALKSISMSGELGEAPELTFDTPLTVTDSVARVVDEGDGDEIKAGDTITFHSIAYSGKTGEPVEGLSSFGADPESLPLDPAQVLPVLIDAVVGQQVGTRFVFANPNLEADSTVILAIEVIGTKETPKPLERATGEAVTPADGLPTVTLDDAGTPSIDIPKDFKEPDDLVVQPLIKGEGEKVTKTQSVTVNYTGWKVDGTVFDSSWEKGQPTSFPLTGVIAGWTDGLAGQTVGSQVLLVVPPELGYGGTDNELAEDTLIFVVDILAAS